MPAIGSPWHQQSLSRIRVVLSASQNIFWNLALEDALFKQLQPGKGVRDEVEKSEGIALLYRNEPSLVVGLHQNPWLECNVRAAEFSGVRVARRLSGGGAVYHDLGNWNLSFITPSAWHKRDESAEFVRRLCSRFAGPERQVTVGKRHDVYCDGMKVAGSAAKLSRGAAYHHFCILFGANLTQLDTLLTPSLPSVVTMATQSVRSRVTNLCAGANEDASPQLIVAALSEELAHGWPGGFDPLVTCVDRQVLPPSLSADDAVEKMAEKLETWDWVFGRTPNFHCQLPPPTSLALTVQKGHVTEVTASAPQALGLAERLQPLLIGQPCRTSSLLARLDLTHLDSDVGDQLTEYFINMGV